MANKEFQIKRPTVYSKVLAFKICKRLAEGESLRSICRDRTMPSKSRIVGWVLDDIEGFATHYARARNIQMENMAEEIIEIADDSSDDFMEIKIGKDTKTVENREVTNRSRLRVDARKWILSKVLPKKYGEKLDLTSDGKAIQGNSLTFINSKNESKSK